MFENYILNTSKVTNRVLNVPIIALYNDCSRGSKIDWMEQEWRAVRGGRTMTRRLGKLGCAGPTACRGVAVLVYRSN